MSRYFPMTWSEWKGGVEATYQLREKLEARLAAGETLSEEDEVWLKAVRKATERYDRSGHKAAARGKGGKRGKSKTE